MRWIGLGFLTWLGGIALGMAIGFGAWGSAQEPPALQLPPPPPLPAPVATVLLAVDPPEPATAAVAPAGIQVLEAPTRPPLGATAPAVVWDASLVPRGPGRYALLDLQAAGAGSLVVRAGRLERDGAAQPRLFAQAAKVGVLRGPRAKVELLHLGFDHEARPVLAHVRSVGATPAFEGVVTLKLGEVFIPLLADPDPPPPPLPADPVPEDAPPIADDPAGEPVPADDPGAAAVEP